MANLSSKLLPFPGQVYHRLLEFLPELILSKLHFANKASVNTNCTVADKQLTVNLSIEDTSQCSGYKVVTGNGEYTVIHKCGRLIPLPKGSDINQCAFIYFGQPDSTTLINLMLTFNQSSFFIYNPNDQVLELTNVNMNRALMKRYYLVECAKDANIVGIVAGTLGVAKYKEIIDHLKALIKRAGKKSYTFVVGKLNPAKLANFAEVDIYVLVSCHESSLVEQKEFYRPIVTPFEMEMACNHARQWDGQYTTEFASLLPGESSCCHFTNINEISCHCILSIISFFLFIFFTYFNRNGSDVDFFLGFLELHYS